MQNMVTGRLAGLEDNKVSIQLRSGETKVFRRKELSVSLEWVFQNMNQPVICLVQDGFVTDVKSLGQKVTA